MSPIKLGILASDEKAFNTARPTDPVSLVVLRQTLLNPPRAAGARALAQQIRAVHADANIVPYVWHLVSHGPEDTLRDLATRSLPGEPRQFGLLQATPEVAEAWQTTLRCAQALGSSHVVLRTPPSFTPSTTNQSRLTAFAQARAAEGITVTWEPEGLWEAGPAFALAQRLHMQLMVPAFDGTGRPLPVDGPASLAKRWLRVDGAGPTARLRGILAETLAHTLLTAKPEAAVVLFAGPRAYANLRAFAGELALSEDGLE